VDDQEDIHPNMVSREQVVEQAMEYLANRISLEDLEDWSAEASIDIHNNPDELAKRLVYAIRGVLNSHEDDASPNAQASILLPIQEPFIYS
jgi:hypothetical protein